MNAAEKIRQRAAPLLRGLLYVMAPLLVMFLSILIGRIHIPLPDFFALLRARFTGESLEAFRQLNIIVFDVRLPRILAAGLVGGALALSGTVYQSLFRNPMVSPGILGVANGAGFGAAVGILLSMPYAGIQFMSFLFGLSAVMITYAISSMFSRQGDSILMMVLVGMVISTLFASFVSLTKYVADPDDKLPAITFWLMGSLTSTSMEDVRSTCVPVLIGIIPIVLLRWKLNLLSFGDEEAKAMGMNTTRIRLIVIICSTVITASAIAVSGIVGWVGLLIPHICRMISGPDHRTLVPISLSVGAVYLMIVDDVARTVASIEIPLGILTSLIGAPFFLYLVFRKRKGQLS